MCSCQNKMPLRILILVAWLCAQSFAGPEDRIGVNTKPLPDDLGAAQLTGEQREEIDSILSNRLAYFGEPTIVELKKRFPAFATASHLIEIVEDEEQDSVIRQKAMGWLAMLHDARAESVLRKYVEPYFKSNSFDLTATDYQLLHSAIMCLGLTTKDTAVEYLLQICRREFWIERNMISSEMNQSKLQIEEHMRHTAYWGIAKSGTDRAVEFYSRRKNVAPEVLSKEEYRQLQRRTKLYRQGIFTDPESDINDYSDWRRP
ncbi:MAG: hypothetical protein IT367_20975 [Candidatus Hydrogenedentes bacterium]|nr:hypothetical protein [Candidatus Hydrogenedentota bacterium]